MTKGGNRFNVASTTHRRASVLLTQFQASALQGQEQPQNGKLGRHMEGTPKKKKGNNLGKRRKEEEKKNLNDQIENPIDSSESLLKWNVLSSIEVETLPRSSPLCLSPVTRVYLLPGVLGWSRDPTCFR
ncbi:hypothetical protein CEXT_500031 [Caerostris extrusa]|uniref:Uncharacterized protein n=1 Tax=Caerostris extrusa TaxID=172846 RepID=A0AAV4SYG5_CAEEX|nr:hypothetical protein CEXT_500031 [Caerostris extrusa]